eukprot:CAMPEP_0182423570 /NCGR_PEP_ID=MMETSP1167-20130531/9608_1 /TAXON_ID=2988 /ORGANISM="Mallomonas Sp, Strain CCMP3275" /LENGTH=40 /DNA_ID= /DNA_START= /DNA_END= /DNA_ORIENTATION=
MIGDVHKMYAVADAEEGHETTAVLDIPGRRVKRKQGVLRI